MLKMRMMRIPLKMKIMIRSDYSLFCFDLIVHIMFSFSIVRILALKNIPTYIRLFFAGLGCCS